MSAALAACGSGVNTSSTSTAVTVSAASTYTVGGGISGLTGQGLTLANSTDAVSPNPGDLNFTFPTALATGAAYAVTIQLQPDSQVCTITAGTGTIGAANVTDIEVSCSAASFSIGGTLTGLTGTGLVLMNGTDSVTPPANATAFTFPTQVVTSTSFDVTVTTQPTGQTCQVTNGTGVVLTSSVSNVAVNCM